MCAWAGLEADFQIAALNPEVLGHGPQGGLGPPRGSFFPCAIGRRPAPGPGPGSSPPSEPRGGRNGKRPGGQRAGLLPAGAAGRAGGTQKSDSAAAAANCSVRQRTANRNSARHGLSWPLTPDFLLPLSAPGRLVRCPAWWRAEGAPWPRPGSCRGGAADRGTQVPGERGGGGGGQGQAHSHQQPLEFVRRSPRERSARKRSPRSPRMRGDREPHADKRLPRQTFLFPISGRKIANLLPLDQADVSICGVSGRERKRFTRGRRARLSKEGQGSRPRNRIAGHGAEWLTQTRIVCRASSPRTCLSFFPPGAGGGRVRAWEGARAAGLCRGRAGGRAGAAGAG